MNNDDLPLFRAMQNSEPKFQVIPFPCHLRHGKIRQAARSLSNAASEKDAGFRLQRSIVSLENNLKKVGISQDVIEQEVQSFLIAVNDECAQIGSHWFPLINSPGGNA